jgi:hypothetical protein
VFFYHSFSSGAELAYENIADPRVNRLNFIKILIQDLIISEAYDNESVFENRALRRIFGPNRNEVTGG